ncbi:protein of unknown function [Aminobacter niigataensis]|nr:protein of unknown function [Aminobacter niigataensis]
MRLRSSRFRSASGAAVLVMADIAIVPGSFETAGLVDHSGPAGKFGPRDTQSRRMSSPVAPVGQSDYAEPGQRIKKCPCASRS